jgi:hypothetical protein
MKSTTRTAALAFGLAIAGSWSLGASDANAQSPVPNVPRVPVGAPGALPPRASVPATPRYVVAPSYAIQPGTFYRAPGRASNDMNYYPARRDLKLYKPWLDRR